MNKNQDALNDVRRKVNEVLTKQDNRLVFGWRGDAEPTRREGDVWQTSDGRQWTVKNGVKQTITKLDDAKTPWWCPKCTKPLNHRFDMKFWKLSGHCMDCQVKEETEIRRQGKWEEYEKGKMLRNYLAELRYKIEELQNYHDTITKPEFINADDTQILMHERWDVDIDKVKVDIKADIDLLQKRLDDTIAEHGDGLSV